MLKLNVVAFYCFIHKPAINRLIVAWLLNATDLHLAELIQTLAE